MSTTTTNLNLTKPAADEAADIAVINANMDKIDTWAGASSLVDKIYPVGSIYLSTSSADPATLFGGTWTRIQDRFLLAAGSTYLAGTTGGEASVALTEANLPAHSHTLQGNRLMQFQNGGANVGTGGNWISDAGTNYQQTTSTGSNTPHNNMPPYLAVYVWQRTA